MHQWKASASVTLVGSMPHRDRQKAIDLILQKITDIPVWPQLSGLQAEQMMIQYLEGLPGVRWEQGRTVVRTNTPEFEEELYAFYQEYLEVEDGTKEIAHSRFQMGQETGKTFFQFLETIERNSPPCRALKGQIVGPFTLLSGLKDQNERILLYDDRMQDVVAKHLAMKARWQIHHLRSLGCPAIVFMDEPALAGFGSSAFISVSKELVQHLLQEVTAAIHEAGALAGIHICANTDWSLALDSQMDIVNFDAYTYLDRFFLYKNAFLQFIRDGRTIAWGMVPTSDPGIIEQETPESLARRWLENISQLTTPDVTKEEILLHSLFTPSCGCGSLTEAAAERVVWLVCELGRIMRQHL